MTDHGDTRHVFRLLVVCTANQCRSPMGAAISAEILDDRGVDAEVASCGSMEGGAPASPGAVRAMRRRGLDISSHVSHQIDLDTVRAADLIITMERRHITSIAELSVEAVERTFTLTELVDLAEAVGPRRDGTSTASWIASVNRMRHPTSVLAVSNEGDIDDPMGGPSRAYRRTADSLEQLLTEVFSRLFPAPPEA